ncbi:MAG: DUF4199 domain-containing protein [Bacteroidota bacterium]
MNSIITKNGFYSAALMIVLFALPLLFIGIPEPGDFWTSEVVGYASILLCLVFVFLGMKQYRDAEGGFISYWKAVKVGLLIAIFPAIAFGLYNLLYVEVIDPDFMTKYADYIASERSAGKTAEEAAAIKKAVLSEQEAFQNPAIQFVVMFLTVFIMGIVVSLVSAFFVKKP